MNYSDFPIFKGITPEAEAYLNKFDAYLQKSGTKLAQEEIFIRKVDLYYDYLNELNKKDKSKFTENIEKNLQRETAENGGPSLIFMCNGIYASRRNVKNTPAMSDPDYGKTMKQWKNNNSGLDIIEGNGLGGAGWIFKVSKKYWSDKRAGKPLHRFVLNVDPNEQLLGHLDKFAEKYACQYKCAETSAIAYSRPDTIVIYTADERFNEQKNELSQLIKPYVRKNGNEILDGEKVAEGLHTAPEYGRKDIEQLIKKSRSSYPRLSNHLQSILDNDPGKSHPLSLGQFTILNDIYESMAILKGQKSPEKKKAQTQDQTPPPNSPKQTAKDILAEGIKGPYSKSEDILNFKKMPELAGTAKADYKLKPNNPDVLNINGTDKDGRPTFSLSLNQKTGFYTYQGGRPEKIYSNDPKLNFPPLPETALSSLKENQRIAVGKAAVKAEMRNGISFAEGDKKISVRQESVGEHENCFVFENYSLDGKPLTKFVVDRTTGVYIAQDYRTGEKFTNSPKMADKKLRELPPEVINKFQNRIKTAENLVMQQSRSRGIQR